jgi:hypothetical protein
MAAPKGNKYWTLRKYHYGNHHMKFLTPADMWDKCCEYFEWAEANPLLEEKIHIGNKPELNLITGKMENPVTRYEVPKMRIFTIEGLCMYIGLGTTQWYEYKKRPEFAPVTEMAIFVIREQQTAGGSAGLLNANLVGKILNLRDYVEHKHAGKKGEPIEFEDKSALTEEARIERIAAILNAARKRRTESADPPEQDPLS